MAVGNHRDARNAPGSTRDCLFPFENTKWWGEGPGIYLVGGNLLP
jgi:hypothetical protein